MVTILIDNWTSVDAQDIVQCQLLLFDVHVLADTSRIMSVATLTLC